jgi:hypothetical protein
MLLKLKFSQGWWEWLHEHHPTWQQPHSGSQEHIFLGVNIPFLNANQAYALQNKFMNVNNKQSKYNSLNSVNKEIYMKKNHFSFYTPLTLQAAVHLEAHESTTPRGASSNRTACNCIPTTCIEQYFTFSWDIQFRFRLSLLVQEK